KLARLEFESILQMYLEGFNFFSTPMKELD
ncbi:hypothetical protein JL09_g7107, partial [Pichia kudriavzevii]